MAPTRLSPHVRNVVSCFMKSGMWIVITPAASTGASSSSPGSWWPSRIFTYSVEVSRHTSSPASSRTCLTPVKVIGLPPGPRSHSR